MEIKNFGDKKLEIGEMGRADAKTVMKIKDFINSLVAEDAMIIIDKKFDKKEAESFIKNIAGECRARKRIYLVAEDGQEIAGTCSIVRQDRRRSHIGELSIYIKNGYRGLGLGTFLIEKAINDARKKIKGLKMIRLFVFCENAGAIKLYEKLGFKNICRLPEHLQYKGGLADEFLMVKKI